MLLATAMSLSCANGRVLAEPWSTTPLIGVVGQYASNPALLAQPQSETNAALVVNLPVNYDLDSFHFTATPSARYGNATGYSSVTSNYFHFDTSAQLTTDLGSTTVTGALYRDSSLFYAGGLENGVGVRREASSADINWQRALNERAQLQLDLSTSRVLFAQDETQYTVNNLVDYRYTSFTPALAFNLSERNTFRIIGGIGRYHTLDDITNSDSYSLQLGFDRQLSEIWTIKTSAGYSKSENQEKFYYFVYYLGTVESTQKSSVYSANLVRQGEQLTLTFNASQALTPTGYAYLSRQQTLGFTASYAHSERWTYTASFNRQTNTNPLSTGGSTDIHYYYGTISANWHWTEQWVMTLQGIRVSERYGEPAILGISNGVSIQLSRQFLRTDL